jgi:CRP/FNR family cyclic AMP-dependent transcriptional regulator
MNGADGKSLSGFRAEWPAKSVLAQVPGAVLESWLRAGEFRTLRGGETLIHEGQADTSVFLLLSGCAKVLAASEEKTLLAVRTGGDLVGEIAALDAGPRSATVVVSRRSSITACHLGRADFLTVLDRDAAAARIVTTSVTAKLRTATRRRRTVGVAPLARLARLIVDLTGEYGRAVTPTAWMIALDLTQQEMGQLIGGSEATVYRAMRVLRERKIVEISGRRLIVKNLDDLNAITRAETG